MFQNPMKGGVSMLTLNIKGVLITWPREITLAMAEAYRCGGVECSEHFEEEGKDE
jgi:hypothetical protein